MRAWVDENLQSFGFLAVVIIAGAVAYLGMVAYAWQHTRFDTWGALLIAPVLIALTVPVARRLAHDEGDPMMARLVLIALVVKLGMSIVRYAVAYQLYGALADAGQYHLAGVRLSRAFRTGELTTLGESFSGTGFMKIFTGALYTLTGPTLIGGFLVFAWIGFFGLYFWYRAFRLAVPDGDHRRYAKLVFFLPSLLFWPSSIGKEALMCLLIGVTTYAAAKIFTHERGGFPMLAAGIAGMAIIRPHIALLIFLAVSVAYTVRQSPRRSSLGIMPKVAGVLVLLIGGIFLLDRVESFLGVESLESEGAEQALANATERSNEGGSSFKTVPPTSPTRFVWATLTVLFRPFPHEATNVQTLSASAEGLFTIGLMVLVLPRLRHLLLTFRQSALPIMAITYILLFCYAFSSVSNFGILTRQRVQVLPFLLILVCLPVTSVVARPAATSDARR